MLVAPARAQWVTWKWDGAAWLSLVPGPGQPLSNLAFDPTLGETLVIAAATAGVATLFEWDGAAWIDTNVLAPALGHQSTLVFDEAESALLLITGEPGSGMTVWRLDAGEWIKDSTALSPQLRDAAAVAYDPLRQVILLYGGRNGAARPLADTWAWDGRVWARQSPLAGPPGGPATLAYDPVRSMAVLLAADASTWTWDGSTWARLTPAGALAPGLVTSMAYDAAHDALVVVAAPAPSTGVSGTWTLAGNRWRRAC